MKYKTQLLVNLIAMLMIMGLILVVSTVVIDKALIRITSEIIEVLDTEPIVIPDHTSKLEELEKKIEGLNDDIQILTDKYDEVIIEKNKKQSEVSRGGERPKYMDFTATAYDLTVASCGKSESHPAYGITKSGYSLVGQDRESAMVVATDPRVIPLGSRVELVFKDDRWSHWNGVYTARDTGGAIKGNMIDIFYKDTGDSKTDQIVWDFGRQKVKVRIVK